MRLCVEFQNEMQLNKVENAANSPSFLGRCRQTRDRWLWPQGDACYDDDVDGYNNAYEMAFKHHLPSCPPISDEFSQVTLETNFPNMAA